MEKLRRVTIQYLFPLSLILSPAFSVLPLSQELSLVAGGLGSTALSELSSLHQALSSLLLVDAAAEGGQQGGKEGGKEGRKRWKRDLPASVVTMSAGSCDLKLLRVLQTLMGLSEKEAEREEDDEEEMEGEEAGRQPGHGEQAEGGGGAGPPPSLPPSTSPSPASHMGVVLLRKLQLEPLWESLSECLSVVAALEGISEGRGSSGEGVASPGEALGRESTEPLDGEGGDGEGGEGGGRKASLTTSSSMAGLLAKMLPLLEAFFLCNAWEVMTAHKKKQKEEARRESWGPRERERERARERRRAQQQQERERRGV
jgi:preprotein translocase subunit SecG